jgi:predicted ABC-type ATPase
MKPPLIMLAGPNGAGKSTFYETYLAPLGLPFLNADNLVRITGLDAYSAAQQIAQIRDLLCEQKKGFITETVLSDPIGAKVDFLANAVRAGFEVRLIFIGIADATLSQSRVAGRVAAGGHDVPTDKIIQRYPRTLENLKRAIQTLPDVWIYDNSSYTTPYQLLAVTSDGTCTQRSNNTLPDWAVGIFQEL